MKLFIEKESTAEDIKKIFTTCYPYLKVELYKKPPGGDRSITKKEPLPLNFHMNLLTEKPGKGIINMNSDLTVAEFEDQLAAIGLLAEVFRRSGNVWIEASLTSNWTLQQQNMEGEEISRHFKNKTYSPGPV